MVKKAKRFMVLFLAVVMLLQISSFALLSSSKEFSDVPENVWYNQTDSNNPQNSKRQLDRLVALGIIAGKPDADGDGKPEFDPNGILKRGEFLKMLTISCEEFISNQTIDTSSNMFDYTPQGNEHWAAPYWRLLYKYGILSNLYDSKTGYFSEYYQSMETIITRYEMAMLINNVLLKIGNESAVSVKSVNDVKATITDYDSIPTKYKDCVEQVYGKGVITGFEDGSFAGSNSLTRAQCVVVIYRLLWDQERTIAKFVAEDKTDDYKKQDYDKEFQSGYVPTATRYLQNGWITSGGSVKNSQVYVELMGSSSKTYFTSSADAAGYLVTVTVPVWQLNGNGVKYSAKISITVNKAVAQDVMGIFTEIYNSPEKFPIQSAGGARFTDQLKHSWGCAIDINPYQNAECRAYYDNSGTITSVKQTCGYGWWPDGTNWTSFAGSLSYASPYSIGANSSVVQAFKHYGWGWAGQGYGLRTSDNSRKYDFMHFSIFPSGA